MKIRNRIQLAGKWRAQIWWVNTNDPYRNSFQWRLPPYWHMWSTSMAERQKPWEDERLEPTAITHEKKGTWSEPNLHEDMFHVHLQGCRWWACFFWWRWKVMESLPLETAGSLCFHFFGHELPDIQTDLSTRTNSWKVEVLQRALHLYILYRFILYIYTCPHIYNII